MSDLHPRLSARTHILSVPEHILELALDQIRVSDCAACCCASKELKALTQATLKRRASITQDDLPLLAQLQTQHRALPTSNSQGACSSNANDVIRSINYISKALQYIARNCKHLEALALWLPNQPASSKRGGPLDHPSLLKRPHFRLTQLWQHCQLLQKLTLINVPARLMGLDDNTFRTLGLQCLQLQHLCIGFEGEQESIYNCEDYYCNFLTDAGLMSLAKSCPGLKSLELMRCNKVTGRGISQVALSCAGLVNFKLHNCPEVSEQSIVQVFERCHELEVVDLVPARWTAAQDLLLWHLDGWGRWQLGFHAMFTLAANCPNLKELSISEEHLEDAVVDSLGISTVLEGCRQLTKVAFTQLDMAQSVFQHMAQKTTQLQVLNMQDSNLTDQALAAVVKGCQQLSSLSMQGPPVLHRDMPAQQQQQGQQQHGQHQQGQQQQQQRHDSQDTVTDAGLRAVAQHCSSLKALHITRNCRISDKGLASLAAAQVLVQQLQEFALDASKCTWQGVQILVSQCTKLQKLQLYGLRAPLQ